MGVVDQHGVVLPRRGDDLQPALDALGLSQSGGGVLGADAQTDGHAKDRQSVVDREGPGDAHPDGPGAALVGPGEADVIRGQLDVGGGDDVAADMKLYDKILARESITYNALLDAGVSKDRLELAPDPAFTLETKFLPLPKGWKEGKTIGLNLSPLIGMYAEDKDIALRCYEDLISSS